ncbi:TIGR01777 family oxidoreductase [Indiicoccus explosivorum]|uniref:TIGR01777 family oxidoreductase n=1 Tax=Indiicoccus explosivorum TaxID=1917864 RepID=UPI000B440795|nr:TIGR01777 family oxidoreductase [Indiicoccus explosivorum]
MQRKIIIAGGTGFVGRYLEQRFREAGDAPLIISRSEPHITWQEPEKIKEALEGADMLINLAGKSVNCRYNKENRPEILRSRTETTALLSELIAECDNPPPLWINASTATIYRHAEDRPMTEEGGEIGSGFSVDVARAWERAFFAHDLPETRKAALRIAIVLGDGGVMEPYRNLVRFGLGGVQGPGTQMFSWIHIEDLYRIIEFIAHRPCLDGVFNCAAPEPVTNRELMEKMRQAFGAKIGLPAPAWLLEAGALFIRTETELILKSRWVIPERLEKEGFRFKFAAIDEALQDLVP